MHLKLIFVLGLACVVSAHDLIVGIDNAGTKIYDEMKEASPAIWRQVHNVTVNATDGEVISRIVVTDQRAEKDGEAKVVEGGEGNKSVTLELRSPTALRGYDFHVEIYADKELNKTGVKVDDGPTVSPKPDNSNVNFDQPRTDLNGVNTKPSSESEKEAPSSVGVEDSSRQARNNNINEQSTSSTTEKNQDNYNLPKDLVADTSNDKTDDEELAKTTQMGTNIDSKINNKNEKTELTSISSNPTNNQDRIVRDTAELSPKDTTTRAPLAPTIVKEETTTAKTSDGKVNDDKTLKSLIDTKRFMQEDHDDHIDLTPADDKQTEAKNTSATTERTDSKGTVDSFPPIPYSLKHTGVDVAKTSTEKSDGKSVKVNENESNKMAPASPGQQNKESAAIKPVVSVL